MARTNAISLLAGASTPATLAEIYGRVIENVQKSTLSTTLPAAGFPVYSWLFSVVESVLFCTFSMTRP